MFLGDSGLIVESEERKSHSMVVVDEMVWFVRSRAGKLLR